MIIREREIFSEGYESGEKVYIEHDDVTYIRTAYHYKNIHEWAYEKYNNTHNRKPPMILSIGQLENMYQEIKIIEKRNTKIDGICS